MGYRMTINTLQHLTHRLYKTKKVDAHQFNAMMLLINEYGKLFEENEVIKEDEEL